MIKIKNLNSGMTLIEIMVAVGILSVITLAVTFFALDVSDFGVNLGRSLVAQQEINLTFSTLISETRSIGPSEDGSFMIADASTSTFSFYTDIDGDGQFDKVRYFLNGGILKKGVIKSAAVSPFYDPLEESISEVVHNIVITSTSSNIFYYYDKNYSGSEPSMDQPIDKSKIRVVKTEITIDETPSDVVGRVSYYAYAMIRNLRYVE